MLFKSRLEKFIAKRAAILYIILAMSDIIFIRERWIALAGLTMGGSLGLFRFSRMALMFFGLLSVSKEPITGLLVLKYLFGVTGMVIVLAISLTYNRWLFVGILAGLLLVPAVIVLNGLTEALGITHNGFE